MVCQLQYECLSVFFLKFIRLTIVTVSSDYSQTKETLQSDASSTIVRRINVCIPTVSL